MSDQLPPACIEAEQAILGATMFEPGAMKIIEPVLPVEAFYINAHQIIYAAMLTLYRSNRGTDFITLSTYLSDHKTLDQVGGMTTLSRLLNRTISAMNIDRYAKLVLKKYQRRQLILLGYQITELGRDETVELSQLYEEIKQLLPESIMEASPGTNEPTITKATYTVISKSRQKELKLEADLTNNENLADSIANLEKKSKLMAESLWDESID